MEIVAMEKNSFFLKFAHKREMASFTNVLNKTSDIAGWKWDFGVVENEIYIEKIVAKTHDEMFDIIEDIFDFLEA